MRLTMKAANVTSLPWREAAFGLLTGPAFLAVHPTATVHYVDVNSANPTPPYTNRAAAAATIQEAIDATAGIVIPLRIAFRLPAAL